MGIYEEFGIRKVINASGTMTHLGGSIPDPMVMDKMKEASQSFVIMMELIEKAGDFIAGVTGAEDGMVTAGASAALILGTAACIMRDSGLEKFDIKPMERLNLDGDWRDLIQRLPDTSWTRNEVIIQKCHRNPYDHAYKIAGGRLIIVGTENGCSPEEMEAAINDRTVAIAIHDNFDSGIPLRDVVDISRRNDIPLIVDAGMNLPPRANLRRYIAEGVDLVAFSGGKDIAGPNDTGILCGRRNLIKLAKLQSVPYRGIGRGMKVDRTQIVGMITALKLWLNKDEEAEFEGWMVKARMIAHELKKAPQVSKAEIVENKQKRRVQVNISIDDEVDPSAADIVFNLRLGNPSIWINHLGSNMIGIKPFMLRDGEENILVSALVKMLKGKS